MVGLEAAPGGPTGHLQFLWFLPLRSRLAVCARALWPVLGGQFRSGGSGVRTWTFGSTVSLQYAFSQRAARLRPFAGVVLGTRVALTETTPATGLQSRETFTPSVVFGIEAGVRYALTPPVQLFVDLGVAQGWLVPGVHRADYEEAAANADSLHASFGLLFEI
jgi:outer membrane protein W